MPTIKLNTQIKADKKIVFDLSRSIDLHKISTKHTNEEAIGGITSGLISLNETVTWKAKHFGIYQVVTSKITAYNEPIFFSDEMVSGIFKSFKHEHHFKNSTIGTEMIDVFNYTSPLGKLGELIDFLFLKKYMTNLLEKRNQTIKEYAESEKWKEIIANRLDF